MGKTKIEWCEETWNPIAGCSDVSEGCRHCYARGMAGRLEAMGSAKYAGLTVLQGSHRVWTGKIAFDEKALLAPLRKKKPTMYFANSMSDLFHPGVAEEQIDRIFAVMALCPQHTFQVLTKRPERMRAYLSAPVVEPRVISVIDCLGKEMEWDEWFVPEWPLPNVWLGVSVEDQKTADARIPLLLQTPAAVRFVSAEPLLGLVEMSGWLNPSFTVNTRDCEPMDGRTAELLQKMGAAAYKQAGGSLIDWVIAGGESGPGARPMHPDWARSLRDQCKAAGVPFFFKQWGEWIPSESQVGSTRTNWGEFGPPTSPQPMHRVGKKAAGHLLDGVAHREWPAVRP